MNTNFIRNHFHSQGDWFGASVYDYIHPEDQEKVGSYDHLITIISLMTTRMARSMTTMMMMMILQLW